MKKLILFTVAFLTICIGCNARQLMVGAAKVDITPTEADLMHPTDIIRGRLYVRAIYLSDGNNSAAIVGMDAHCFGLEETIRRSSERTGIPVVNYIISSTHTHTGGTAGIDLAHNIPTNDQIQDAVAKAILQAKENARPARVGFGRRPLDLNVNRDNYNEALEWEQGPNWTGPVDKDLTVLSFLDENDVPIAVYLNYGMHPVNFLMSGVVSPDFPGDACDLIEKVFGNNTVAVFSQAASGDANPALAYTDIFRETAQVKGVRVPKPTETGMPKYEPKAVSKEQESVHKAMLGRKDEYVRMLGNALGFKALEIMLYDMQYEEEPVIRGVETTIRVPGRKRLDQSRFDNYDPGYEPDEDVTIGVGLLQIGDINLVSISGELYTEIGYRIKHEMPASKVMIVTLADGPAGGGYIYSDKASSHLTFQVISSRLQPGYAESAIVSAAVELARKIK